MTKERLREALHYCPDTGIFTNKARRGSRAVAGTVAGYTDPRGYVKIGVNGKKFFAHRLAWLYHYGEMPCQIDHINHNRSDNRICNLRLATQRENTLNQSLRESNSSGIIGVLWDKARGKWRAQIKVNYVLVHLGRYDTFLDACCARKSAEVKYGFHPNHGRKT